MTNEVLGVHLLVIMSFVAGVIFGMVLDAWVLPFLVDLRVAMLRRRER